MTIIDSHTHIYPEKLAAKAAFNLGKFYNFTVQEKGTAENLKQCLRGAGIGGFVLLATATNANQVDRINEITSLEAEKARKEGFTVFALGGAHQDYGDWDRLVDGLKKNGLLGVKIHPDIQGCDIDDPRFFGLYERLEKNGMTVCFHMGDDRPEYGFSSPEKLARVAEKYPSLRFQAAHLGGYRKWDAAKDCLCGKFGNVWYDCSQCVNVMKKEDCEEMIYLCGTDRVMFGTDFPAISPSYSLECFMRLSLGDEDREKILGLNALEFYGE